MKSWEMIGDDDMKSWGMVENMLINGPLVLVINLILICY